MEPLNDYPDLLFSPKRAPGGISSDRNHRKTVFSVLPHFEDLTEVSTKPFKVSLVLSSAVDIQNEYSQTNAVGRSRHAYADVVPVADTKSESSEMPNHNNTKRHAKARKMPKHTETNHPANEHEDDASVNSKGPTESLDAESNMTGGSRPRAKFSSFSKTLSAEFDEAPTPNSEGDHDAHSDADITRGVAPRVKSDSSRTSQSDAAGVTHNDGGSSDVVDEVRESAQSDSGSDDSHGAAARAKFGSSRSRTFQVDSAGVARSDGGFSDVVDQDGESAQGDEAGDDSHGAAARAKFGSSRSRIFQVDSAEVAHSDGGSIDVVNEVGESPQSDDEDDDSQGVAEMEKPGGTFQVGSVADVDDQDRAVVEDSRIPETQAGTVSEADKDHFQANSASFEKRLDHLQKMIASTRVQADPVRMDAYFHRLETMGQFQDGRIDESQMETFFKEIDAPFKIRNEVFGGRKSSSQRAIGTRRPAEKLGYDVASGGVMPATQVTSQFATQVQVPSAEISKLAESLYESRRKIDGLESALADQARTNRRLGGLVDGLRESPKNDRPPRGVCHCTDAEASPFKLRLSAMQERLWNTDQETKDEKKRLTQLLFESNKKVDELAASIVEQKMERETQKECFTTHTAHGCLRCSEEWSKKLAHVQRAQWQAYSRHTHGHTHGTY